MPRVKRYDAVHVQPARAGVRLRAARGDGRAELADELAQTTPSVRTHVVLETRALLAHPEMRNALPGIVTQAIRVGVVLDRLQRIAALAS